MGTPEGDLDKMRAALDVLWHRESWFAYAKLREEYHVALFQAGRILEEQIEKAEDFVLKGNFTEQYRIEVNQRLQRR